MRFVFSLSPLSSLPFPARFLPAKELDPRLHLQSQSFIHSFVRSDTHSFPSPRPAAAAPTVSPYLASTSFSSFSFVQMFSRRRYISSKVFLLFSSPLKRCRHRSIRAESRIAGYEKHYCENLTSILDAFRCFVVCRDQILTMRLSFHLNFCLLACLPACSSPLRRGALWTLKLREQQRSCSAWTNLETGFREQKTS